MGSYIRRTDEEIIEALHKNDGLITRAAKALGVGAGVIYDRRLKVPAVDEAIRDAREGLCDLAQEGLRHHLIEKAPWAISLTLKTLGKSRGFVERVESREITDEELDELLDKAIAKERAKLGESERLPRPDEDGDGVLARTSPAS